MVGHRFLEPRIGVRIPVPEIINDFEQSEKEFKISEDLPRAWSPKYY
jgi:hypothetical protein